VNHYCTYFDRNFLVQGLALWRSLAQQDRDSVLWVLALDGFTAEVLRRIGGTWLRVVTLPELETGDPALAAARANRSLVEYYFTLSPCWPRWLLTRQPDISRITYVDADMLFFADPEPVLSAMDTAAASVLITAHRFPPWLRHYERHGRFNVGLQSFRNDDVGRACLDEWRASCLAWCYDRLEEGRYADQKYLDAWPQRLGRSLLVLPHPGVNLAPWNWMNHRFEFGEGLVVDGEPLVLFHFARFRALQGDWWWQSGQLDYGVMPWRLRQTLYGAYWHALQAARREIKQLHPEWEPAVQAGRLHRAFWRGLPLRLIFGSDWWRVGDVFISGRLGLGRYSGRVLAWLRTILLRP
jgi:hypothetical protein